MRNPGQELEITDLPLKTWTEDDVDIQVTHCGICGSDVSYFDRVAYVFGTEVLWK